MKKFIIFLTAFLIFSSSILFTQQSTNSYYIRVIDAVDESRLIYSSVWDINNKFLSKSDSTGLIYLENVPFYTDRIIIKSLFYQIDTLIINSSSTDTSMIVKLKRDEKGYKKLIKLKDPNDNIKGTIFKTVVTDEQYEPLIGALVYLEGTTFRFETGDYGIGFGINVPPGTSNFVFKYVGYEPIVLNVTLPLMKDSVFVINMRSSSDNIDTVLIDFNSRMKWKYEETEIVDTSPHKWNVQFYDSTTKMHHLSFINENTGWVIGDKGIVLKTTDGGLIWEKQNLERNLYDVSFINQNTGYLSSDDFLYRTVNGGISWDTVYIKKNLSDKKQECRIKIVYFKNEAIGFTVVEYIHLDFDIFVLNYVLQETTDAGNSWNTMYLGTNMKKVNDIYKKYKGSELNSFDSTVNYYLSNNVLYKTIDSGINWKSLYPPGLSTIFFVNKDIGYAISAKGKYILKTITGGE